MSDNEILPEELSIEEKKKAINLQDLKYVKYYLDKFKTALTDGTIKVGCATDADNAVNAEKATHATNADQATNATNAENAVNAENAKKAVDAENAEEATNANKIQNVNLSENSVAKFGDYVVSKLKTIYKSESGVTSYTFTSYPKKILVYFGTNAGGVEEGESMVIYLPNSSFTQYGCERLINVSGSDVFKIAASIFQNSLSIARWKNASILYNYKIYEIYEIVE